MWIFSIVISIGATSIISYILHKISLTKTIECIRQSYGETVESLSNELKKIDSQNKTALIEDHVKKTIDDYYDHRTLRAFEPYINTIQCSNEQKAAIYELSYKRVKSKVPENNPYIK